jgi:hypothetical protein
MLVLANTWSQGQHVKSMFMINHIRRKQMIIQGSPISSPIGSYGMIPRHSKRAHKACDLPFSPSYVLSTSITVSCLLFFKAITVLGLNNYRDYQMPKQIEPNPNDPWRTEPQRIPTLHMRRVREQRERQELWEREQASMTSTEPSISHYPQHDPPETPGPSMPSPSSVSDLSGDSGFARSFGLTPTNVMNQYGQPTLHPHQWLPSSCVPKAASK